MDIYEKLYSEFQKKLLSPRWLNKVQLSRAFIDNILKSKGFKDNLKIMVSKKDFSCKSTLALLLSGIPSSELKDVSADINNQDLLLYLYNFVLYKTFPEATTICLNDSRKPFCELYFKALRIINSYEKFGEGFSSSYPLEFLSEEEEHNLEYKDEYLRFVRTFKNNYIYEMMKLNGEITGFNTLDHICGVHYLSLNLARQLKHQGLNLDLGRVSGAAAGHDLGKFGCKENELDRVPYLHYYYSHQWFKKHDINYIGHIAVNHSTWDLELENLSLESLILIYSDFRVKNAMVNGSLKMTIYSLKDSFQVILNKLDNLDEKKIKRYKRVYAKLEDFENFMKSMNVDTTLGLRNFQQLPPPNMVPNTLCQGNHITNNLKYMAINHNINLMYSLRDEYSLDYILEQARSEKDWKNLREYIRIFQEYSTYFTEKQKFQTINFLYENLIHPEDDIRRHCAELMGSLIAIYDEEYRKEIPKNVDVPSQNIKSTELLSQYIDKMLFPSHKIISTHRYWMGYSLSIFIDSLFRSSSKKMIPIYGEIILNYYDESKYKNLESPLFLLESAKFIPISLEYNNIDKFFNFIFHMLKKKNSSLRLSTLNLCCYLVKTLCPQCSFSITLREYLLNLKTKSSTLCENYLRLKLAEAFNDHILIDKFSSHLISDSKKAPEIFLSNLKTATDWVKKRHQVEFLLNEIFVNKDINPIHGAIHFCNLLKVSAVESVRNSAGEAILSIMDILSSPERNEVAIELLRGLEIEGHRFTEYIPKYLGQVFLYLSPKELDEIIDDLIYKVKISNISVKTLIIKTIGFTCEYYDTYRTRYGETLEIFEHRRKKLLGILLNGLGDFHPQVKQAAFSSIGKEIFGSHVLSLEQKERFFHLIGKKLLSLMEDDKEDDLLFFSKAAGLNHIYRFISDYTFFYGDIVLPIAKKVAFFPGTFDPFSLSHEKICKTIRDLGYEVYLAIDEFSWSKKTLPNILRRNILNMSIASELDIYIYPGSYPTNLSNEDDLITLKNNFKNSEVYIVAGGDVVINASSYKKPATDKSIHNFSHIIIERNKYKGLKESLANIKGNIHIVSLPNKYTDISSTQIRNYIDDNRDISSLVDPLAQQYIYENGFYQREPLDKSTPEFTYLDVDVLDNIRDDFTYVLKDLIGSNYKKALMEINKVFQMPSGRLLLLKDNLTNEPIGFSLFHWSRSTMLYDTLHDVKLSQLIREKSPGRIIFLDGLYVKNGDKNKNLLSILLSETLAFCSSKDYEYAIFNEGNNAFAPSNIDTLLQSFGFVEIPWGNFSVWHVDMSHPSIINLDLESLIKEPFKSISKIKNTIASTRLKLQKAICELFPGHLILPLDVHMLNYGLIKKVCSENNVLPYNTTPRMLGEFMCVPYGDILDRYIVPNTVTKSLHTEKYFNPFMTGFNIGEFPHYLCLENQIKMLKSFNKPVILVDNILHKGYRMKALDPIFKKENVEIQKIIAGILSGQGRDLMTYQGREVDSVYFIPRLNLWFNETALYPFIGGDAVWRGKFPERNLVPSINLILPYTSPIFIKGASMESLFNFSKTCIENSIEILKALEDEFHKINERNLTLSALGQVFTIPRCVDHGKDVAYDLSLTPSHYLENDLEQLKRLSFLMKL